MNWLDDDLDLVIAMMEEHADKPYKWGERDCFTLFNLINPKLERPKEMSKDEYKSFGGVLASYPTTIQWAKHVLVHQWNLRQCKRKPGCLVIFQEKGTLIGGLGIVDDNKQILTSLLHADANGWGLRILDETNQELLFYKTPKVNK